MEKVVRWTSDIDGKSYNFVYEKAKGNHTITVNEETHELNISLMSEITSFDEKFTFDGRDARLVIRKKQPDVVVDGICLRSGERYVGRPAWSLIFAVLCLIIPIVSLGGAIPVVLGLAGAVLCTNVSKTSLSTALRVILCSAITILAWIAGSLLSSA